MATTSTSPHTIAGLLAAYRDGTLTPADVLQPYLSPAADRAADPAWITLASPAFVQAQIDRLQGHSPATLPLYGIPFAAKDNIDVAGLPTTAACPDYAYEPQVNATVIERLMAAGAIVVGKTNLDQFATGLVGTRSPYGIPRSTFSADHVSGGSSAGSAVVVARGDVCFSLGTDTAGSGRVPAGFNNLVGLKPTPGLVPITGVVPACKSLDCVSIFALTASDAARVLAVMEGPDAGAPVFNTVVLQSPRFPRSLRIGVPTELEFFGDAAYVAAFEQAKARWSTLCDETGAPWPVEFVPVDLAPFSAVARLLYEGPWVAERYAAISEFIESSADKMNPVVRGIIEGARRFDAQTTFKSLYKLRELAAGTTGVWDLIDFMLVPTTPTHPTVASVEADPVVRNSQLGTYTNFVNLLGLSALALPAGFTEAGMPFGITLIAPGGADAALADVGVAWQQGLQGHTGYPLGCRLGLPSRQDLTLAVQPEAAPTMALAVVGAHLSGMPLHGQLVERGARLRASTTTSAAYKLYALPGTVPPKPGLVRVSDGGAGTPIAVEVYDVPLDDIGSFLALIPPPLGLGSVELADGSWVKGFICEPCGVAGAQDISEFGGWRAYMKRSA
ncbi:allophanate hydrolase [Aquabacterium sp.]|uniref:allophanate hydrolase n=1 Tax=Aquabacterium sp. TaxID=1872578 RepID=UPI0035B1342F